MMEIVTLDICPPGEQGTITELCGEPSLVQRLMELGFVRGALVGVVKYAPLGDPLQIAIRGYSLSLRRGEAKCITMRLHNNTHEHDSHK
ncbi:MAG: hypothetical protein AUJ92_01830 [Armatimonadetes bacterium CG2_30_59_28]|nr:ferrous iron transport protein A [Armatimonadota bacterium]OIO98244.1 MAG: hypothetical protein AUJ92_01830 [Armatimonadetes bacterium CG2_30_59_28]PIU65638.1 MAG: hypothetical protein COS85_08030 [Armatimonadetes bacterium CG07_land_8_20_14_0_80_59_28]PIX44069.1 MAG: hypothetical protein COZ56_05565 [Armatimonadetes bacterium CG_4_8_14_3_um_filter_58_9]PIY39310.1 MAG: hypothetical protein COZ05_19430 [Armatimonadetes bacterium CG_4_10_14_3_um_filter_59_10]